jgi:hypothetical protein
MKNQIITGKDDLEDKFPEVGEYVNGGLLESLFSEQIARLEWEWNTREEIMPIHTD